LRSALLFASASRRRRCAKTFKATMTTRAAFAGASFPSSGSPFSRRAAVHQMS
jgi:hypothetical protein